MHELLKRIVILFGTASFMTVAMIYCLSHDKVFASTSSPLKLQPYFSYTSEELKGLEDLNSDKIMTQDEIDQWIQLVFDMLRSRIKDVEASRAYTYLFIAHRDAAALSYKTKNKLAGSLSEVSKATLCLVLPKKCDMIPSPIISDPYSLKIAEIVTQKIKDRLKNEKAMLDSAPKPIPPKEWDQNKRYFGSNFGQHKTWLLVS